MAKESDHQHTDAALDETLEETFPASDAPANTVETGIRIGDERLHSDGVRDNSDASRFEITKDGQTAFLTYERGPKTFVILHTEVPDSLKGGGIGGLLAKTALHAARAEGLPIVVRCPFVQAYLKKHPELREGVRDW